MNTLVRNPLCLNWSACLINSLREEVETDTHGIQSSSLRSILENWPKSKSKPKVLYTVPVCPS